MKIGIINDVHGNDQALKAILPYFDQCDEIISVGDLIAIGPNSKEVLDIVKRIPNFTPIMGNHENYLINGFNNPTSTTEKSHQTWVRNQLYDDYADYIKTFPWYIIRNIQGLKVLFIHYARLNNHYTQIMHNPCVEDMEELFKAYDVDVIVYGHDHKSFINKKEKLFLNAGSTGCPHRDKDIARGMILTFENGKIDYKVINTKYNVSLVLDDMDKKKMPTKEEITKRFYM